MNHPFELQLYASDVGACAVLLQTVNTGVRHPLYSVWEAEPSVIRPLSCGTNCQYMSGKQTPSLTLRFALKLSFLIKLIVRDGSGEHPIVKLL